MSESKAAPYSVACLKNRMLRAPEGNTSPPEALKHVECQTEHEAKQEVKKIKSESDHPVIHVWKDGKEWLQGTDLDKWLAED